MELQEKILDVIRGTHVAALATVGERGAPVVRHMMLTGLDDLKLVGGARADSDTAAQLRRTPYASIAIWSEKEFTDPYVQMQVLGGVHEDRETKLAYWDPIWAQYFGSVENPEFVVLLFRPESIEYYDPKALVTPEVWRRG
ncbi:MAG: pyridoxamine 5'-phosphate oxidase family protein [Methanospirillum sp.]